MQEADQGLFVDYFYCDVLGFEVSCCICRPEPCSTHFKWCDLCDSRVCVFSQSARGMTMCPLSVQSLIPFFWSWSAAGQPSSSRATGLELLSCVLSLRGPQLSLARLQWTTDYTHLQYLHPPSCKPAQKVSLSLFLLTVAAVVDKILYRDFGTEEQNCSNTSFFFSIFIFEITQIWCDSLLSLWPPHTIYLRSFLPATDLPWYRWVFFFFPPCMKLLVTSYRLWHGQLPRRVLQQPACGCCL